MRKQLVIKSLSLRPPPGVQLILGQSHFIKTVEDLYEALITSSPGIKFGIAFCESSGPALARYDGNDAELAELAAAYAQRISAGHFFVITMKEAFPINVLNRVKLVDEVVNIYCATGNAVEVIFAETQQGRGVLGVVDGISTQGIEGEKEKAQRRDFLREIGYKK